MQVRELQQGLEAKLRQWQEQAAKEAAESLRLRKCLEDRGDKPTRALVYVGNMRCLLGFSSLNVAEMGVLPWFYHGFTIWTCIFVGFFQFFHVNLRYLDRFMRFYAS